MQSYPEQTVKFGLRLKKTGQLLGCYTSSNEGRDFCGNVTVELLPDAHSEWLVDMAEQAEYVRQFSTPWYNADYDSPMHNYEADELEVVRIEVIRKIDAVSIRVPTMREFLEIQRKTEPHEKNFYDMTIAQIDKGIEMAPYPFYQLHTLIRSGKWK